MKNIFFPVACIALLSCQNNEINDTRQKEVAGKRSENTSGNDRQTEKFKIIKDKVHMAPFTVFLEFSPELDDTLKNSGEVVNILIEVTASNDVSSGRLDELYAYMEERGNESFFSVVKQVYTERSLIIKDLIIDKKVYDLVGAEHFQIQINTYTGRKVFENNILSSQFISENFSRAVSQGVVIRGDLLR